MNVTLDNCPCLNKTSLLENITWINKRPEPQLIIYENSVIKLCDSL